MRNIIFSYGVDVGGTKIEFAVFECRTMPPVKLRSWVEKTHSAGGYEYFLITLAKMTKEADELVRVRGETTLPPIGIGFPGIVDNKTGSVQICANVAFLQGKHFRDDFRRVLGHPNRIVKLENDANCFALSEAWNPALTEEKSGTILGLILGTGVGGGIIAWGRVCSGKHNVAGELGHMRVTLDAFENLCKAYPTRPPPRFKCGCHPLAWNCLDRLISGSGFSMLWSHFLCDDRKPSCKELCAMYDSGDARVVRFGNVFLEFLAASLSAVINFIDPSVIVIGGGFSNWDVLYKEVPSRLKKYLLRGCKPPLILKARYGDAGGVRGAALLNITDSSEGRL